MDLASSFSSLFKKKAVEAKTETNDKPPVSNNRQNVGRNKTHANTGNINDAKVKDERVEDTLLDLANYCIMLKMAI